MSFVKKAAKKVFKGAKKVVKKVWKPALIAGATLFTGGLAAGGFAAFSGATTLGGFMGAVGQTMAVGGQAMLGSLGLTSGVSGSLSAATGVAQGTTLFNGALAQGLGLSAGVGGSGAGGLIGAGGVGSTPIAGVGSSGFAGGVTAGAGTTLGAAAGTGSNFIAGIGKTLGGLASGGIGKMALFQGISGGIQSFMASREAAKERKINRRRNFAGGPMRGGSAEGGFEFPDFSQGQSQTAEATNQGSFTPPAQQQAQQDAFASAEFARPQQQLQGQSIFPQSPLAQPGNLDLIGPDEQLQRQGLFQGAV